MIRHDVEQGSPQWLQLRAGKPTASCFDKLITPAKGEPSKSSKGYMLKLLAERFLGHSLDTISTAAMETGREREPQAISWYEFTSGVEVERVGFCTTDDGKVGASPDFFAPVKKLGEVKCPNPETHLGYLLAGAGISETYRPQIQGQLYVCEREELDSISFCHGFPASLVTVGRDEGYITKLDRALVEFLEQLDWNERKLIQLGCAIAEPASLSQIADVVGVDPFGVNESDVAAIWAGRQQ